MCGRYALYGPVSRIRDLFDADIDDVPPEWGPRYNVAPMQFVPVIRQRPTGERVVHLLRWGLVPSWSRDESIATKLINARGETLADKPSFRSAFKSRRCIIPVSGFYEWKQAAGGKQPYYIQPSYGGQFDLAGLWERWTTPEGERLDTFTIVTTEANDAIRNLHARMPVILRPEDYGLWLDKETALERVQQLIAPFPVELIRITPVSKAVGNVGNEGPGLIVPTGPPPPRG